MKKKILYGFVAVLIIIQFFRIDKNNPKTAIKNDFIVINKPNDAIATMLKSACYDCHSNESKYPWYTNVAPISWWVKDHINEGREELNFSVWAKYTKKRKLKKFKEIIDELEENDMPLIEYTWIHKKAKLSEDQNIKLIVFFKTMQKNAKAKKKKVKQQLHLNNGQKWSANKATVQGIDNMIAILAKEFDEERVVYYASNGQKLEIELNNIIANCTMKGDAHNQLHLYLMPLKQKINELKNCSSLDECPIISLNVLRYLNQFKDYFVVANPA